MDFGKYKYEQNKRQKESKQTSTKLKEVKFRVGIDEHDFVTKLRRAEDFLDDGNKVKLTLSFRGREMEHQELGHERLKRVVKELEGVATPDSEPRLAGRHLSMTLSPLPVHRRKLKFRPPDETPEQKEERRKALQAAEEAEAAEADEDDDEGDEGEGPFPTDAEPEATEERRG